MYSPDAQHSKQVRQDSPSAMSASQPQRSMPWFDDGNVVLEAEGKQFRVYRGILSENSVVFNDMFDLSRPGGEGEVEGCPVVRLSDRAEDLRIVLEVLHRFGTSYSHFVLKEQLPFTVVAAFMRLGTKYEIEDLRAEGIRRLHADYPSTLELYDELRNGKKLAIEPHVGRAFDIANLARETGTLSVLPVVLYSCCRIFDNEGLFEGCQTQDGNSVIALSPTDQKICILAKDKLLALQARETFGWLDLNIERDRCAEIRCKNSKRKIFQSVWYPKPKCAALDAWTWSGRMCVDCEVDARGRHAAGRAEVWSQLPSVFALPDWEELLDE